MWLLDLERDATYLWACLQDFEQLDQVQCVLHAESLLIRHTLYCFGVRVSGTQQLILYTCMYSKCMGTSSGLGAWYQGLDPQKIVGPDWSWIWKFNVEKWKLGSGMSDHTNFGWLYGFLRSSPSYCGKRLKEHRVPTKILCYLGAENLCCLQAI